MATETPEIILFHYNFSPYGRRVVWYLQLRGIKYTECLQPPILPRPDLSSLSISYRRIPILAIGRDIYCDTRAILSALETHFPWPSPTSTLKSNPPSATLSPTLSSLPHLLSTLSIPHPTSLFSQIACLLPPTGPLTKDPAFIKDRTAFSGRSWDASGILKLRPEALVGVRDFVEFLEAKVLGDGRGWILDTPSGSENGSDRMGESVKGPTMADLEAVWALHWIRGVPGALEADAQGRKPGDVGFRGAVISGERYPKVWAWMDRWDGLVKRARGDVGKVERVDGKEAKRRILAHGVDGKTGRGFAATSGVDGMDPLGLEEGVEVEVWATDSGFGHKDRGRLVGLGIGESVIEKEVEGNESGGEGGRKIRLHFPRIAFRVREVGKGQEKL